MVSPGPGVTNIMSYPTNSLVRGPSGGSDSYLVVLAVPVHHPVLSVSAELQFEGGDIIRLGGFLGDRSLCGDPCQNLEEVQVHLKMHKYRIYQSI